MSDSFTAIKASGRNDLDPLMHSMNERNNEKFSRVFNQQLAVLLGILRFSASNSAAWEENVANSPLIPPKHEKTVKEPCSTWIILSFYAVFSHSRFFCYLLVTVTIG